MSESKAHRLKEVAVEETREFLPVFFYIWILLGVLGLHRSIILSQAHIVEQQGFAFIKALALAKVVFIAEKTPLGRILADRPLIWPVLAKSAIFGVVLLIFDVLEELLLVKFLPSHAGEADFDPRNIKILLSTLALTMAALIPFFGLRELGRVIGESEMMKLFFRERQHFTAISDAGADPLVDEPYQARQAYEADTVAEAEGPQEGQYYLVDGHYYYFSGGEYHLYTGAEGGDGHHHGDHAQ